MIFGIISFVLVIIALIKIKHISIPVDSFGNYSELAKRVSLLEDKNELLEYEINELNSNQ